MKGVKVMPDTFRNRLIKAMEVRNMKAAELSRISGLSKPRISQYVNGTYEAKQQALYSLAKALNVSEAWLMGYDTDMEKNQDEKLLGEEVELIEKLQSLYGKSAVKILELFVELNEQGQEKAINNLADLTLIEQYKK